MNTPQGNGPTPEECLDLLADLQHDLGKYLALPLSFLPSTASPAEVQEALHQALFQTRRSPGGHRSARQLWDEFHLSAGPVLGALQEYTALSQAVERALGWERALGGEVERARVETDLFAVAPAIRVLLRRLEQDGR